jgi:AmmeMemoRadiSam system protein B
MGIRQAAVAGTFYPDDSLHLQNNIKHLFADAEIDVTSTKTENPQALILPHAGYIYSGVTAAKGYRLLHEDNHINPINKVLILGPSHRVGFSGIAVPESTLFATPLGNVAVHVNAVQELLKLPFVISSDEAHQFEHSLEVHLPFLQSKLNGFEIIPLVVGDASVDQVTEVIDGFLGMPGVLVVISTDLSHFLDYKQAQITDQQTSNLIIEKQYPLKGEQACGCRPLNGLLKLAKQRQLSIEQLALCNSGDTAGDKSRVVGYGAYVIY